MEAETHNGGTEVVFNLATLRRQLELKEGRDIPWREIADESDLNVNTVVNMANNKARQVHTDTLTKLLWYFRRHGMPIGVGDLFKEVDARREPLPC